MDTVTVKNVVNISHIILKSYIEKAQILIDMTAGNGHDTLFIAKHMPETAQLIVVDIQPAAIEATRKRLATEKIDERHVCFITAGHESVIIPPMTDVAMFNLGYLPAADHHIHTQAATTIAALQNCLVALSPGGIITLAAYPGTEAGRQENIALNQYVKTLPQQEFHVSRWEPLNEVHNPPILYILQKR